MSEPSEYPRQLLAFFFAEDSQAASLKNELNAMLHRLSGERRWVLGAPKLLDEVIPGGKVDDEVRTLGGTLEVFSALPPSKLPIDVDRKQLEDVAALVAAVQRFSADTGAVFEFQLGDTFVGAIEAGKISATLQVGLLDEWSRVVE
jgi:hypothetical protein